MSSIIRTSKIAGNTIEEVHRNGKYFTYFNNQLVEGSYDEIVKAVKESKKTMIMIKSFIKEFNKMGDGVCVVRLMEHKKVTDQNTEFIRFEIFLAENRMLRTGILAPTDDYFEIVKRLGEEYFNTKPDFNNTGCTFWFWIRGEIE